MRVSIQSIVKPNNDIFDNNTERLNEDAVLVSDNFVAIADGAGGVGIIAQKWAETLVQNIKSKPFNSCNQIDKWVASFWEEFYESNKNTSTDDSWKIKKFEDEGSLSTLSVVWKDINNKFHYESYGDTALFVYNNKTGKLTIQKNMNQINSFSSNPPLINWKTEQHDEKSFYKQDITLNKDESIIIATDGLAMYIYGAYMVFTKAVLDEIEESKMLKIVKYFKTNPIHNFVQWMDDLKASLTNQEDFRKLTNNWYNNCFLPNDDYSIAWIESGN